MDGGVFDWMREFGRAAPRVLDVGCGDGRYLIASALARPEHDHVGIEVLAPLVAKGRRDAERRKLPNLRFITGDALRWLLDRAAEGSLDEIHAYHPQPYYDPSVVDLDLLGASFFERAWRVLKPGGLLVLQTDSKPYGKHLLEAARKHFEPEIQKGPWPDAPKGRTRREEVAQLKKLEILRVLARRRERPLEDPAPQPYFQAGRAGLRTVRAARGRRR